MSKLRAFLLLIVALSFGTYAQTSVADEDSITYKIKAGDTLIQFAQKYLKQPVDFNAIKALNHLQDIDRLAVGLEIHIPRPMLKQTLAKARVMSLSCVNPIRLDNASILTIGSTVSEGAVIEVPPECQVALLLEDSSLIRLPSGATLEIRTLRKNLIETAPEVRLFLTRGRIELDVNKQGRSPSIPFEVKTPISVMGVRGTKFRVGYSPDDKEGQVEVLGGIVETRGSADDLSRPINKGFGVPINAQGNALNIEKLLPPPTYNSFQVTQGTPSSYVVNLVAVKDANYYIANIASTANLSGTHNSENLLAPEIFIPRLTKQAVFYQLTSVSQSGLIGDEQNYAFCSSTTDTVNSRCTVVFDAPLAFSSSMSFSLARLNNNTVDPIVQTQTLQAKNGRFALQGLPPGHYQWSLSYNLSPSLGIQSNDTNVRQSGIFELITLPSHQP